MSSAASSAGSAAAASSSSSSLPQLRIQSIDPLKTHRHTVIFMHGLGDSSLGFASMFAGDFMSDAMPHTRFVLPNAPIRPVTVNGGERMPAWYDIRSLSNRGLATEDRVGMLESATLIRHVIAEESDRIGSENVTVAGFSQGGAMAVLAGLSFDRPLARIFAASAYVVMRDAMPEIVSPANASTLVLAVHGDEDPVVPIEYSRASFDDLADRANVPVTYLSFEGIAHEFPSQIEAEFAEFCEPSEKKFNAEDRVAPAANADESYTTTTAQQSSSPKL